MRRSTFPMIAAGVLAAQGCADHDEVEERVSRHSGFFLMRRASDACLPSPGASCAGFVASSINSASTQCPDGRWSPSCDVAAIDLSALHLPSAQSAALIASITPSLSAPDVVLRGRLTTVDGHTELVALEAWRAPSIAPVRGAFHAVSTEDSSCTYLPCASVMDHRLNASLEPEPIAGVDLSGIASLDPVARDNALADAASDTGLLVAGTQSYGPNGRVLRAEQVFTRVRPSIAPGLCADALRANLDDASSRLLYPSETDAPIHAISPDAVARMPSTEDFADVIGMTARPAVRAEPFEVFMQPLTSGDASTPAEQLRAARFRSLERALRAQLTDLRVYRVGTVDVKVYVVGLTACGELAGVETTALER